VLQNQGLWDAVAIVERETRKLPTVPGIRKRDLVHLAVDDFANRRKVRGVLLRVPGWPDPPMLAPLRGPGVVEDLPRSAHGPERIVRLRSVRPDPTAAEIYVTDDSLLAAIHARFVADLDAIVTNKVTREMLDRIEAQSSVIVVERHFVKGRRLVEWRHYLPKSPDEALAYVLALLLTAGIGKRSDLRRCRLPSCRDFFFCSEATGDRGAPRTSFCTAEHAEHYRRLTVAARVKKSRAGKAKREAERKQLGKGG
jgi:hypothetical protein